MVYLTRIVILNSLSSICVHYRKCTSKVQIKCICVYEVGMMFIAHNKVRADIYLR